MGLKDVKNDILREARDKASQLEEEAQQKEDEILGEARDKAEQIKENARKEIEEKKESERKKAVSSANMEARNTKLAAKQEKLEEVFSEFKEELENLDEQEREDFVKNAVEEVEFEIASIKASEQFAEVVDGRKNEVTENSELDGFVLISENGERRKNFSIDKIVRSYKEDYRQKVAEKLFEEE